VSPVHHRLLSLGCSNPEHLCVMRCSLDPCTGIPCFSYVQAGLICVTLVPRMAKACSGCPGRPSGVPRGKHHFPHQAQTWYRAEKCSSCRKFVVLGLYLLDLMLWSCLDKGVGHKDAAHSCLLRGRKSQYSWCQTRICTWISSVDLKPG